MLVIFRAEWIFGYDLGWCGVPSQFPDLCSPCLEEISVMSGKICFGCMVMQAISTN